MFKRSSLPALLASAAALLTVAAPAAASTTLGPQNLSSYSYSLGSGTMTALNLTSDGSTSYAVPADGNVSSYSYKTYNCPGSCVSRLLVMRHSTATTYDVVDASSTETGSGTYLTWPVNLDVLQGDYLAIELTSGGLQGGTAAGTTNVARGQAVSGSSFTFNDAFPDNVFLYNVEFTAGPTSVATSVTVDAPSRTTVGDQATYEVHVDRLTGSDRSGIDGTVSLDEDGTPIVGCQAVTVVAGEASCTTTVTGDAGHRDINATYSGDAPDFDPSSGGDSMTVKRNTSTTAGLSVSGPADPGGAVTYTATVTPPPAHGFVLDSISKGTVAFSVDGVAVTDCAYQTVNATTGVATCATTAPTSPVDHVVKAVYSGGTYYNASNGEGAFTLKVPGLTVPASADAGSVGVGKSGTTQVTVTNSGALGVDINAVSLSAGDFTVSAGTCTGRIEPGAICAVNVTFTPTAAGARTATLTFADGAGGHTVALTGTGVAAAAPTPTPTPTPTPPTGAKLAPNTSTTLVASPVASSQTASLISLRIACAVSQTCEVSGTLGFNATAFKPGARVAAAVNATIAKFSKVRIGAGKAKSVKLKLDPAFVRKARKAGMLKIKGTLTLNTTFGDGTTATTKQQVTIVLPKVVAKKKAAAPKFTG